MFSWDVLRSKWSWRELFRQKKCGRWHQPDWKGVRLTTPAEIRNHPPLPLSLQHQHLAHDLALKRHSKNIFETDLIIHSNTQVFTILAEKTDKDVTGEWQGPAEPSLAITLTSSPSLLAAARTHTCLLGVKMQLPNSQCSPGPEALQAGLLQAGQRVLCSVISVGASDITPGPWDTQLSYWNIQRCERMLSRWWDEDSSVLENLSG